MPLANFGTLVLHHIVFVAHLVYFHIAFSHMEQSALVALYCVSKLLARRADDIGGPPPEWPPPSPSEEHPPFFSHVASAPAAPNGNANGDTRRLAVPRPALTQRPSYITAIAPEDVNGSNQGRPRLVNHSSTITSHSLNHVMATSEKTQSQKVGIRDRIACYQWTYFTLTMSTGGIANILHSLKWTAPWLRGIGLFFFFLNIILFIMNCILIYQMESLFISASVVSIAVILINTCQYGIPYTGPWLLNTMEWVFWVYAALSVSVSAFLYLVLWSTLVFPVHTMTPTWVFPAYPLLLNAPFAANLIAAAESSDHDLSVNTVAMALGATAIQGTGCLIAFMISSAFIYRLMTQKLPRDNQRPAIVGPYGFTAAGIAQLGSQADLLVPENFLGTPHVADIIKVISILVSLWLWGLAMWFFLVCVGALWKYSLAGHHMPFQMTWWSFVFPNTALVTATSVMGKIFDNNGLHIFASVMTVAIVIVWIMIFTRMCWSLKTKKLLWPKDEK
ncbi:malic acid transport protein [Fusarium flagelliforme]|uniref:Malic acid transport protein n=1 Tax=Fusarium flagelliforme TaxID=2675880 RepID=A0A395MSC2_9HYPO|nr:malic acid transport protein [Fusarium flagelliforme]